MTDFTDLDTDKLCADWSLKLPEILKEHYDRLPAAWKKEARARVIKTLARVVHDASFDYRKYTITDD